VNRFDYVKYDEHAVSIQNAFKEKFIELEAMAMMNVTSPRAKALVLTKLEEAYMWVGKAIRDDQIMRTKDFELQEERDNG
jgi:hypothetical protein